MNLKTLEQQLKTQNWTNNFQDTKLLKKLFDQTVDAIGNDEKVFSLTCAHKVGTQGEVSPSQWLLVLTNKEILFVELDLNEDFWHSSPERLKLLSIDTIEGVVSHLNAQATRINLIGNEKAFVFESVDFDSVQHFINKTQAFLKGDLDMNTKTINDNSWETIEKANPTMEQTDNNPTNNRGWTGIFNLKNPYHAWPLMEIICLTFQLIWLICDLVFIGLMDNDFLSFTRNAQIGTGVVMLIAQFFSIILLTIYLVQIWDKNLNQEMRNLLLINMMMFLMMITAILILAQLSSAFTFGAVGVFTWFGITVYLGWEMAKKISVNITKEK